MSVQLRLLNAYLRRIEKPWLARVSEPDKVRRGFARSAWLMFRDPPFAATLPDRLDGVPSLWTQVRPTVPGVILYLHGGAYLMGEPSTHCAMLGRLSQLTGLRACLPQYRLAPENPFPAALDDAHQAWRALIARGYPPNRIVLGGDSAGGGLMLALLARLLAEGACPAGAFAMSPWTDMSLGSDSLRDNAECDPVLPAARIRLAVTYYLGDRDPRDPGASPLFAKFPDAPPVFLQVAESEILRDDTLRMVDALRSQGATVTLDLWQDTPHVWPIFQGWLPEADEALARIAGFIAERFRAPRLSGS